MARALMTLSNPFTHDSRVRNEVRSLVRAGHSVTVLGYDAGGSLPVSEERDGATVLRVRDSLAMRATPWALARLPGLWRLMVARASRLEDRIDILHAHDFDTLPAAVRLKRRLGIPLVYDAHELFPYVVELSRARFLRDLFESAERRALRHVDHAIAAGPRHAEYLRVLGCDNVSVVLHGRDPVSDAYRAPTGERLRIAYLGGLEAGRFLVPLAEFASENPAIEVRIAGRGPLEGPLRSLARTNSLGNLEFLGLVPEAQVMEETMEAHVVFAMFDPARRIYADGTPNKLFEAMACGRPILVSDGTWAATVVREERCGLAAPYTRTGLREAVRTLLEDPGLRERMGRNALRAAQERYSWTKQEPTLLEAYRELLDSRRDAARTRPRRER